jgi:isoquinoline 1-oxidoreductase beta subunit
MVAPVQSPAPNLDRRQFLIGAAVVGAGLYVGFHIADKRSAALGGAGAASFAPNAFVRIGTDDAITVILGKSEMGQGVYTGLPMVLAEELDVNPARVKVEFAPVDRAYYTPWAPAQLTGGSSSTNTTYQQLRQAGATARAMLIAAAAATWKIDSAQLGTNGDGAVTHADKVLRYGELAAAAAQMQPPKTVTLKDPATFRYIGKRVPRLDSPAKVSGRAEFGLDVRRPDMLFAMVARAPVFGAKLVSFDDKAARAVSGVVDVRQVPSGVAVLATNTYAARKGRDALETKWDLGPGATFSTEQLAAEYRKLALTPGPAVAANVGDAPSALASGKHVIEAVYEVPFLAHACMEPLNCVAHVTGDRCDVWTGTQWQSGDQLNAAKALGFKPEQVNIHTTFLGGGFGRRGDAQSVVVVEAVLVAKAVGKPVQVVWTREDDMRGGFYRPLYVHRARAVLDDGGMPHAWEHVIVGQSVFATMGDLVKGWIRNGVDPTSVEGISDTPYAVPNLHVTLHSTESIVPPQSWRSVGHTHTGFVANAFIDELAAAAKKDPLEYRRALLANKPRELAVLNTVAEKSGWGAPLPAGRFRGVALHYSFGTVVAQVAEVSVTGTDVRVHRVVCAVDCGQVVNPDQAEAQIQSAIVFGLSAALRGAITVKDGRVEQSNFDTYEPLRMNEMPVIETHFVRSDAPMGGMGEPGTPCIAPAVCNAIFAATGKRIRTLPISTELSAHTDNTARS